MNLIESIRSKNIEPSKTAVMYYKTEPLYSNINNYSHTNNWEIVNAISILCELGFEVDLIDRGNKNWKSKKNYDLFLGLGVGNSGDQFVKYAKESKALKKVLLAMGPQPDLSNKRTLERYEMFKNRTGYNAPPMRTVEKVCGSKFLEIIDNTDYIFTIGEKNNNSYDSFLKYNKPIYNFFPGISDKVKYIDSWSKTRNLNEFLCFAGNGLICKGVDLVLEAFLKDKSKKLHICGPPERSFFNVYEKSIIEAENIFYHGFIEPGGKTFNEIASKCAYTIFNASSEGCCTSVATTMKAGLVPIINSWTGINIKDNVNGIILKELNDPIIEIQEKINYASSLDLEKYNSLLKASLLHSKVFSQESFIKSYKDSIIEILN